MVPENPRVNISTQPINQFVMQYHVTRSVRYGMVSCSMCWYQFSTLEVQLNQHCNLFCEAQHHQTTHTRKIILNPIQYETVTCWTGVTLHVIKHVFRSLVTVRHEHVGIPIHMTAVRQPICWPACYLLYHVCFVRGTISFSPQKWTEETFHQDEKCPFILAINIIVANAPIMQVAGASKLMMFT